MKQVFITCCATAGLTLDAASVDAACLSADERERGARLVFPDDRRDFLAAHVLLRRVLSAHVPRDPASWSFVSRPSGKPHLAGRLSDSLTFNLSHTRGLGACAVAHGEDVGIDAEAIAAAPDLLDLARAHFAPQEVAELERLAPADRAERFTAMWTLKEAYLKATGSGISRGLDEVSISLAGGLPLVRLGADERGRAEDWHFVLLDVPGYRVAVAVHAPGERVRYLVDEPALGPPCGTTVRALRLSSPDDRFSCSGVR